jgi:hypothetical protein
VMAAAQNGQLAALRLVLAAPGGKEAAVAPDDDGDTPLLMAALGGRTAEARLLLERGADPNLCMNDGKSPLIYAACAPGDAGHGAAALLLDAKADVDHPDMLPRPPRSAFFAPPTKRSLIASACSPLTSGRATQPTVHTHRI